jgi:hypothetical protein
LCRSKSVNFLSCFKLRRFGERSIGRFQSSQISNVFAKRQFSIAFFVKLVGGVVLQPVLSTGFPKCEALSWYAQVLQRRMLPRYLPQ